MNDQTLERPLRALLCPLCGQANDCAPARRGHFDGPPCWCRDVHIAPEVLARVPPALTNRACLCRRCARAAAPHTTTNEREEQR